MALLKPTVPIPWRKTLGVVSAVTAVAALAGSVQLVTGTFTPPVDDLSALGLRSWVLPGVWLALSVGVPSTAVAVLARRRSPRVGVAAVAAGTLLLTELLVQIPFVGPDPLQGVMGIVGIAEISLGLLSARQARLAT